MNVTDRNEVHKHGGIEILRLVSMLMIVALHILGDGGVLRNVYFLTNDYFLAWMMETCCYGAVNMFALISGYVSWNKKVKYSKWVKFWIDTFLFVFILYLATRMLGWHQMKMIDIYKASVSFSSWYWYIRSYLGLLVLMPIINVFVQETNVYMLKKTAIISILVFVVYAFYNTNFASELNKGYSVLWLMLCYLWGGVISKGEIASKLSAWKWLGIYVFGTACAMIGKVCTEKVSYMEFGEYTRDGRFVNYISPFIFAAAIGLFCFFVRMPITLNKIVLVASKSTLGVYLVHLHPVIRKLYIDEKWAFCVAEPGIAMYAKLLMGICCIFVISLIVSIVIRWIIDKIVVLVIAIGRKYIREE